MLFAVGRSHITRGMIPAFIPYKEVKMDEVYQEGYEARKDGIKKYYNPYDLGTDDFNKWNEGYEKANEKLK